MVNDQNNLISIKGFRLFILFDSIHYEQLYKQTCISNYVLI